MRDLSSPRYQPPQPDRVGWGFVARYAFAYMSIALMLIAPLLVTLALKVRSLVGVDQAPSNLALVTGIGGLMALVGNPLFGGLSDRTSSRLGMRRPWMLAGAAVSASSCGGGSAHPGRPGYFDPRRSPDLAWAFLSRFLFISAFAFLTTYQAYYLIARMGSAEAPVPHQIFVATRVQSVALVAASLAGGVLYAVAGLCAALGALTLIPVKGVR